MLRITLLGGINTGKHICAVGLGKDPLDKTQKAQNIKKVDILNSIKI